MADRRLPIYLLVDTSASMEGVPIKKITKVIQEFVDDLSKDQKVLNLAWLSVITFGGEARQLIPLVRIEDFQTPELIADGGSVLGPALSLLCECRRREVVKATQDHCGDWRPIVVCFTNAVSLVGDFEQGVRDFKKEKWGSYVFAAMSPEADVSVLKRINPERILKFDDVRTKSLLKYVRFRCSAHKAIESVSDNDFKMEGLPPLPSLLDMDCNIAELHTEKCCSEDIDFKEVCGDASFDVFEKKVICSPESVGECMSVLPHKFADLFVGGAQWGASSADGLSATIGWDDADNPVKIKFDRDNLHGLIGGPTGSGKSNLIHVIICSLCHCYSPEELQICLLDMKDGVEAFRYLDETHGKAWLPHARSILASDSPHSASTFLDEMAKERQTRNDLFKRDGANNISSWRRGTGCKMPRILVIIDEFVEMFSGVGETKELTKKLADLLMLGRSCGMHVLLVSQNMDAVSPSIISPILDLVTLRLALPNAKGILADCNIGSETISVPQCIINECCGKDGKNTIFVHPLLDRCSEDIKHFRLSLNTKRRERKMIERRLPVYLLLDVSGSMDGVPIQAVNDGIQQLVSGLRADRFAVEKVWLSIITFGNEAKQIVPLTWLEDFQMPNLVADGMTALGPALSLLCECREREVVKATAERRGDYSPVVIVLTDGCPTEGDFEKGVGDFKAMKWGNCICCGIGPEADMESLKRISDAVLHLPSEGELSGEDVASVFKRGLNFRYF